MHQFELVQVTVPVKQRKEDDSLKSTNPYLQMQANRISTRVKDWSFLPCNSLSSHLEKTERDLSPGSSRWTPCCWFSSIFLMKVSWAMLSYFLVFPAQMKKKSPYMHRDKTSDITCPTRSSSTYLQQFSFNTLLRKHNFQDNYQHETSILNKIGFSIQD